MATVGTLDVLLRLNSAQFQRNVREATQRAQRFGRDMQRVGRTLSTRVTLPLAAIGAASVKMAVDAEESANKFNVVMGGAADDVRDRFRSLQDTIPLTQQQMEALGAGVQDLLVPLGFVREEAANMSADMVELAADLASFNNVAADVPLEALKSALAGQSRPLRQFGIDVSQARLELLALEEGLISEGDALDANARAQAIFIAAQRDSADAIGDAARTADSAANQFRFLRRDLTELAQGIGEVLVPAVVPMVSGLRDVVGVLRDLEPATQKWVVAIAAAAAAAGPLMLAIGTLLKLLPLVAAGIGAVVSPVGLAVAALGSLAFTIGTVARNWTELRIQTELAWAAMVSTVGDSVIAIARWMDGLPFVGGGFAELADTVEAEMSEMLANTGRRVHELEQELSRGFGGSVDHVDELEAALGRAAGATDGVASGAANAADAAGDMADALADQLETLSTALDLDLEREGLLTEALDLMGELSDVAEDQTKSLEDRNKAQQDFNRLQTAALESMTRQSTDALGVGGVQRMTDELKALPEAATVAQEAMFSIGDAGAEAAFQFEDEWVAAIQIVGSQMGGLASQVANVVGAFATGGMGAGLVAGAGLVLNSLFGGPDRVEEAAREWERELDNFVDMLADQSRLEQLRSRVAEQASDVLAPFFEEIERLSPIMRESLRQAMDAAQEALDAGDTEGFQEAMQHPAIQRQLERMGMDIEEFVDAWKANLERLEEIRQEEIAAMQGELSVRILAAQGRDAEAEAMRLQIQHEKELEAARQLEDKALIGLVKRTHEAELAAIEAARAFEEMLIGLDLDAREARLSGDPVAAATARAEAQRQKELQAAEDAFRAGEIGAETLRRWAAVIEGEFIQAVEMAELAMRQDMQSLEMRLLQAQGRDMEVLQLRQLMELERARAENRSEEYIQLLQMVQVEELRIAAMQRAERSMKQTSRSIQSVAKETERAASVLNAPQGLRLSLRKFQAQLAGTGMEGDPFSSVTAASPSFTTQNNTSSSQVDQSTHIGTVTVVVEGSGDPEATADAVVSVLNRRQRAGGPNPIAFSPEA